MRRLGRLSIAAALLAVELALLLPAQAFGVQRLALSSGTFKYDVKAGDTVKGEVIAINDGDSPMKVLVYSADQLVDGKGNITFNTPSRADLQSTNQPSAWVRLFMPENSKSTGNIPYLELKPKQRIPVKFEVSVPKAVPPGDHNVILFFEMFTGDSIQGTGAQISGRLGSRLQLRVQGPLVQRLEVSRFAVPTLATQNSASVDMTLKNLGNVDQRVVASMRLLDRNGDAVSETKALNNRVVFVGTSLESSGTLLGGRQLFGPYTVRVDAVPVDENGQPLPGQVPVTEKRSLWFVPMWALVVAGMLIVLIILRLVWGAGRRSMERRHRRELAEREAAASADTEGAADKAQSA